MFQEVKDADFVKGEHEVLRFWNDQAIFRKLREQNAGKERWSFLDGPITANNPMGVHHAWGRTYMDTYQRFFAMMGRDQRYQTEQSVRLGYWMDWDDPNQLRNLAEHLGTDTDVTLTAPSGKSETGPAHQLVERLGNPEWGGSYFTFSTENNETIWTFLKKCFTRGKI